MNLKSLDVIESGRASGLAHVLAGFSNANPALARADLERIWQLADGRDGVLAEAAYTLAQRGFLDEAEQLLRQQLADSHDFWSERALGLLQVLRQDMAGAIAFFEQLCLDHPTQVAAYSTLIQHLSLAGDTIAADTVAERALRLFPDDIWLLFHSAHLAERRGRLDIALQRWMSVSAKDKANQQAREGMARILMQYQKYDKVLDVLRGNEFAPGGIPVDDLAYRCPVELKLTPSVFRRCLVIGSCLSSAFPELFRTAQPRCESDFILINYMSLLPDAPPQPVDAYDFQFLQIPLRSLLHEGQYLRLNYDQPEAYRAMFDACCDALTGVLPEYLKWNVQHGLLSFVSNFLVPQQNTHGRLLPRYDLRNFVYFIERLNEHLSKELERYQNVYLLDIDQISATLGRRSVQEDMLWQTSHGSVLSNFDFEQDQARLEALHRVTEYYPGKVPIFTQVVWREIEAMYRSVRQIDTVKLVLVDLDDTLWRGVLADNGFTVIEGWPLGFAEALMFLKQRGILLGIVSKNTEQRVRELWPYDNLLPLDAFASLRINWNNKADNIAEILSEVNLLPQNVLYIDDNPVERAAVQQSFSTMRVLGANPYLWRRILLWSAETQGAAITAESARRTDMVKAQGAREQQRKVLSRDDFLASLQVDVSLQRIDSISDAVFVRALELINKTNQFNTSGERWTAQQAELYFQRGGAFHVLHVKDQFTAYGLVVVICTQDNRFDQFVMSCRVVGLDVELAAVALTVAAMRQAGVAELRARLVETPLNLLAREIWPRCGFVADGGPDPLAYLLAPEAAAPGVPSHIRVVATLG